MLSDVMTYFGLKRTLDHVGYFETQEQTNLFKELKPQIRQGRLIALTGVVGCGKTTTLQRLQLELSSEKDIIISRCLAIDNRFGQCRGFDECFVLRFKYRKGR
jgi:type II secretory pathway predicted ATPase ExeA